MSASVFRLLILPLTLVFMSCVATEKRDVANAREAVDACHAEHGEGHSRCSHQKQILIDTQQRYEENARRRWGCDPMAGECPRPR